MSNDQKISIQEKVMSQIRSGQAKMKPRWHFILSSLAVVGGLTGFTVTSVFLVSLATFSFRTHGPMGAVRYQQLLSSFPWWVPVLAVAGIGLGIWLLRKYDFSYKKNFVLIAVSFAFAVALSGWLINYLEIDNIWMKRGPMRELYKRYDAGMMRGPGWRMMQNGGYGNQNPRPGDGRDIIPRF